MPLKTNERCLSDCRLEDSGANASSGQSNTFKKLRTLTKKLQQAEVLETRQKAGEVLTEPEKEKLHKVATWCVSLYPNIIYCLHNFWPARRIKSTDMCCLTQISFTFSTNVNQLRGSRGWPLHVGSDLAHTRVFILIPWRIERYKCVKC